MGDVNEDSIDARCHEVEVTRDSVDAAKLEGDVNEDSIDARCHEVEVTRDSVDAAKLEGDVNEDSVDARCHEVAVTRDSVDAAPRETSCSVRTPSPSTFPPISLLLLHFLKRLAISLNSKRDFWYNKLIDYDDGGLNF
ncbi:hypothetical protein GCM10027286_01750 [Virgibacillus ainsalahensis]